MRDPAVTQDGRAQGKGGEALSEWTVSGWGGGRMGGGQKGFGVQKEEGKAPLTSFHGPELAPDCPPLPQ